MNILISVVSEDVKIAGVNEVVYMVCLFDYRNLYIRKWVYEKINTGEFYFTIVTNKIQILNKQGEIVPMLTPSVY